ncbi:hypothetical protein ABIA85_005940 [Bradyrhizobium sp. LA6.10]|uniref:hypothetical protein n=1 Tax=Bradyrhizobium sp. LA6.10 TaxID=3156318 RepID=UPI0033957BE9
MVIDTNGLKSDELKEYLSDPSNVAVLPDFAILETLKIGDAKGISDQLATCAERPKQIKVLKPTYSVAGLRSRRRSRGLQRRLVDKKQTAFFKTFCGKVEGAKDGDQLLQKQLKSRCEAASFDLEKIVKNQETFTANLAEHAKNYTEAELKILRKGEPITPELFSKITGHIFDLLLWLLATHPYFKKLPDFKTLPNAFLSRFAVAGYVVALRCIKEGGANGASAENIGSQMVDAMFATYATYFDGILTKDRRCQEIYDATSDVLKVLRSGFTKLEADGWQIVNPAKAGEATARVD